ncbi:hypothetical protein WP2_061 [Pseudomonas phage WP2]
MRVEKSCLRGFTSSGWATILSSRQPRNGELK